MSAFGESRGGVSPPRAPKCHLISPEGQKVIAGYKINGQQLFYPNASDPNA
jgi:ABC-type tungstate transport system permease subunit